MLGAPSDTHSSSYMDQNLREVTAQNHRSTSWSLFISNRGSNNELNGDLTGEVSTCNVIFYCQAALCNEIPVIEEVSICPLHVEN